MDGHAYNKDRIYGGEMRSKRPGEQSTRLKVVNQHKYLGVTISNVGSNEIGSRVAQGRHAMTVKRCAVESQNPNQR